MSLSVRMLFEAPQREAASILTDLYRTCRSASLVSGFMTVEGIEAIAQPIRSDPSKLETLIVGAATWRAFDAFDSLLRMNVPPDRLRIHLGHSRTTKAGARHPFYRYHPMLHSKVYLFEMPDQRAAAFIGSHNLTGFALHGLNGEAATLVEGESDSEQFEDLRRHIVTARAEAVQYDPAKRDAYAWWAFQFMEGLKQKFNDKPREGESVRTIILLVEATRDTPQTGDVIYFELPKALGRIQSIKAEVHVYVFHSLPSSPGIALAQLTNAQKSLWCNTIGLEDDRGGRELRADWYIDSERSPKLKRASRPFRPTPAPGMQQIRVEAREEVYGDFEYLFGPDKPTFEPVFDEEQSIELPPPQRRQLAELNLIPPEDLPWFRVVDLKRREDGGKPRYEEAMRALSPESGAFVLMSVRRRTR